jgi:hypothetical protein
VPVSSDSGMSRRPWNSFRVMPATGMEGEELLGRERAARAQERRVVREARRSASLAARWEGCVERG